MMSMSSLQSISGANPMYMSDLEQINTPPPAKSKPRRKGSFEDLYDFDNNYNNNTPPPLPPGTVIQSGKGTVEITVAELLKLVQTQKQTKVTPPQSYFVSKASFVGVAQESCISLKCTFEIAVLVNDWLKIKLLSDSVALKKQSLKYKIPPEDAESPRIGVVEGGYHLICSHEGELVVELDVVVPYTSVRRSGMTLWVPRAAENVITFTVPYGEVDIKVDPSFVSDDLFPNVPEKGEKPLEKKYESKVTTLFPPSNSLSVNWTVKIDEGPSTVNEPVKVQQMMITAEHNTMCSIGEGVVVLTSLFNYSIVHGSASTFEIAIPNSLHVLGVEGLGIKKWEVIEAKNAAALIGITEFIHYRLLRVVLNYGLEDSYYMTVISELTMKGTSADVLIPSFKCIGEEIKREKGHLAIEARTNVEIAELKRDYLAMVDTSELPQKLFQLAGNAILMAYKFLASGYFLELRVKKHDDVGVLIAACDSALFTSTMSAEGKLLHKLILHVRNSQKQYVRVKIPTPHEIWSASVAGTPVKPAMDEDQTVMIQLQKSSSKQAANNVFIVELVYIETEIRPLRSSGELQIEFAQLDIPINFLFVSVNLPTNFKYGAFKGNLKEVLNFSRSPPNDTVVFQNDPYGLQLYSNYSGGEQERLLSIDSMTEKAPRRKGYQVKGVVPVRVEMPVSGTEFKFEQLIVMGGNLAIRTTYTENKTKQVKHRKSRCCCW